MADLHGRRNHRRTATLWVALASALPMPAQSLLGGAESAATMGGTDLAVLEARETRKDLPCTVTPVKPTLGFDLKFHAGYELTVPLKELSGSGNLLTIVFRVTSEERKDEPVYLTHKFNVPSIEADAKGDATLQGDFDLGEGKYQVDWLMRDRTDRVCASFWDAEAVLPPKDRTLAMNLAAGTVAASDREDFIAEPARERDLTEGALTVKMLVNFAPQSATAASMQPADTTALVSILRTIERDPHVARFSVVAFNLQQQRVLYRQPAADHIDFPAIGDALKELQLGRVGLAQLQRKHSDTEFLSELIKNEFKADGDAPDALVIAGPKVMLEEGVPAEALKLVGEPEYPVFYMNYSLFPQLTPWRDTIGQAVRHFKGQEFTISRPRDLWFAVTEMVAKIVKLKSGKRTSAAVSSRGSHEVASH